MSIGMKLFRAIGDIDESFLEDLYDNKIFQRNNYKKNRVNLMKKILSIACVIFLLLIGVSINDRDKISYINRNEELGGMNLNDEILLNEYIPITSSLTGIEQIWKEENIINELVVQNKLIIPNDFEVSSQGKMYIKEKFKEEEEKFQEYRLLFKEKQKVNKYIEIDFSNNLLLKKVETENYTGEIDSKINESIINGVKVKIFAINSLLENDTIKGIAYWEYNNYKIRIEVSEITVEQFVNLIKSAIETFK